MRAVQYALRRLLRTPGFTSVALLTLALGIGVNTSMFSIIDALLFHNLPFPESERLVQLTAATPQGERRVFSEIEMREMRERITSFESLATIGRTQFALAEPGRPAERIGAVSASAEFFATFRVQPVLGRAFTEEETQPGRNDVVLISHRFWQERYGGEHGVIGRTVRLDGQTVTIIGVLPASFDYRMMWGSTHFWRPLNFTTDQLEWRDYRVFQLIGRLAPGATPERAAAELGPVAAIQASEHPESYSGLRYQAIPLASALNDELGRKISWMLFALALFVLLIACANLANLQLVRTTASLRDLAVRTALGASRRRLILLQLTDCILLSIGGALVGLLLATGINRIVERNFIVQGSTGLEVAIDLRILGLTLLVAVLTGILFGIFPAWLSSRASVTEALKSQSRGSTAGRGHHRVRQALIVGEVALALVLLGGAAIMQRGFAQFMERESGWDTDRVLTATLPIPETRFENNRQRVEYFRAVEQRLTELPGVESAAVSTSLPLFGYTGQRQILIDGQSPAAASQLPSAFHVMITPRYFETMGIRLVDGRRFAETDDHTGQRVIIVNESLARNLWPGESAIGKRIGSMDSGTVYWAEVVGVARNVEAAASLSLPATPFTIYKPLPQEPWSFVHLIIRTPVPGTMAEPMRRAVALVDPDIPADNAATVSQFVDQSQHNLMLAGKTLNWFAALGIVLAAIGIYGVIANLVAQRTSEFGIRLALGARPADVMMLVLRHGIKLSLAGLLIGLLGAYGLARFLAAAMPRLASPDPVALIAVSLLLLATAVVACWIPARRVTRIDPLDALRTE